MKTLRALGFVWLLPATILVWFFYVIPLWGFGYIEYDGSADFLIAKFRLAKGVNWYSKLWDRWWGWSGPCVLIIHHNVSDGTEMTRTLVHEIRHCKQQFVFGAVHYPLYFLCSLIIWITWKLTSLVGLTWMDNVHPYIDNPFERDARHAAGQPVVIPREEWGDPKDRWPWW